MEEMDWEETRSFLLDTPRTAKIATVRPDGRPHITPIWFDLDGETLIFTTWHESVKAENLHRDGHVAICVDDEIPPFAFVIIEGLAEFIDDPEQLFFWAKRISGRYMGTDQAESYGRRNAVPGELLVRVKLLHWIAHKGISD
jgi:PPOX class probable F420-dependent enzyme